MAQIFPEWANQLPQRLAFALILGTVAMISAACFFLSPRFTDVGYEPRQPINFSHRLHAGDLEVDCRYCHNHVETAATATLPTTETCMNCHSFVGQKASALEGLRLSEETGEPIRWIRVHRLPDYVRFDHGAHLRQGVACNECHGEVRSMERLRQSEPLSMRWCLDCHRDSEGLHGLNSSFRPGQQASQRPQDNTHLSTAAAGRPLRPPVDCSGCHQ